MSALLTTALVRAVFAVLEVATLPQALLVGMVLWLFGLADSLPHAFFEQRPFGLTLLHSAYHLLTTLHKAIGWFVVLSLAAA